MILIYMTDMHMGSKEIPYKEGILKDIGAHVGYTVL
jgi:hypothetical protein